MVLKIGYLQTRFGEPCKRTSTSKKPGFTGLIGKEAVEKRLAIARS